MARKYKQGRFKPLNPEKYVGDKNNIVYRSSWELVFLRWADRHPSVVQYNSEEIVIPYYSEFDGKWRRYFMDFIIQIRYPDESYRTFLVEIKPESQTHEPIRGRKRDETYLAEMSTWMVNRDKWNAAREYAQKNGMEFMIMTEYDLGIKKRQ